MTRTSNVVDGRLVPAASAATSDLLDPCTGKVVGSAPLSRAADVDAAYAAAARAFPAWRRLAPAARQQLLLALVEALEDRVEDLVEAEVACTGKPVAATRADEVVTASTTSATSRASPARWRAPRPRSTSTATPPTYAASRSAWSARWRRGTTRS